MVTPLDGYVKAVTGSDIYYGDFYWPLADSKRPFQDFLEGGSGAVMVTILSIDRVYPHSIYAYITYKAKINKVIAKPRNTVETPPQAVCAKDPASCYQARKQYDTISNLISRIREGNTIELIVPAFIARDAIGKSNLSIRDVATPFPLLEPGYQYIVFLDPELDGVHVHYDYVWGPWAYLVWEGRVYSLNYVRVPGNVSLEPSKLFSSLNIRWAPYPYDQLRETALRKLRASGVALNKFIAGINGS